MKTYKVQVVFSYVQIIEVDAHNIEEAEATAFDLFDLSKANKGEGETWILEEVTK